MSPDRAIAVVLSISLAVVLLLGMWLLRRGTREVETLANTPTIAVTAALAVSPTTTAEAASTAPAAARGYRLAGTVVGDLTYAIIEAPNGANQLYRLGQSVPGLGEVTAIEADRITLAGREGTFALQLAPAPTATPLPPRTEPSGSPASSVATPAQRSQRDQSRSESSP